MGFQEAIRSFYRRYLDFQTRSSRSEYWWVQLFQLLVVLLFVVLIGLVGGLSGDFDSGEMNPLGMVLVAAFVIFALANIIPGIAVAVRRFHDQDKSGWFYLLALIPYVGGIILIVFMCLKGTNGPNRFGEDPLGNTADVFD